MEGRGRRWESRMMESRHDDTAHGKQADYLHMSIYRFIIDACNPVIRRMTDTFYKVALRTFFTVP